ncbi:interleukin-6 receptor subunit alpha isoform X2 [Toxotes jaculatrix]|uniref:interleukin-6 receptor subunit alpha isoform X2 n=1 Tax=Toxotes jaculatrix TaxID=941984 RepID=UPI001B3AED78|nr:interleukin-6 receptor subunit alpha isoform X2 [Toxotes jaculatrix]
MRFFLALLCVLCVTQGRSIFDGICPRRDPPPGVLVLSPGSKLVLTCKGHVMVDGIKVSISQNSSNTNRRGRAPVAPTTTGNIINSKLTMNSIVNEGHHFDTTAEVSAVKGENTSLGYTDATYTASPTTLMVQPTSVGRLLKGQSDWEAEEVDGEGDYEDYEEEEGEELSRVTRGIKSRPQWKWNGKIVGATLSLSSVRVTDSGRYTCHHRGRERFSLKVLVAEPPEKPSLSCYKKSPSSKIRCEWTPQRPVTRQSKCYLIVNKRTSDTFLHLPCSYSSRLARYWCTLDHNEDELRTIHMVFLCVTNITCNATSAPLYFIPMDILKPDPPTNVKAEQEEGHKTWLNVTWNSPTSWKHQDRFYELIYEVKYRPKESSFYHDQLKRVERSCSYTITDVMPGVEYLIQLRTRDEYDGQWSDWSTPIISTSWTGDDLITTTFPASTEEGSCADDYMPETNAIPTPTNRSGMEKSYPILWISGSFVLLSVILAVYIFRHKDRFMSKLHHVSVIIQSSESSHLPPTTPAAPGGQALVTFSPSLFKEHPPSKAEEEEEEEDEEEEEENGEEQRERIEAMHFNNTSYFLIQRE